MSLPQGIAARVDLISYNDDGNIVPVKETDRETVAACSHQLGCIMSLPQGIAARVALVNGNFDLPEEAKQAMGRIRETVAACSQQLAQIVATAAFDEARLTAALDMLQAVKNTTCDAVLLPYAPK